MPTRTPRAAVRSEYEPIVFEPCAGRDGGNAAGDREEQR
jgi:hypothetical protein